MPKLAAQKPKIYTSTLPMTQAVASGEIIGAPCAAGTALDLKKAGAPIDYKVLPDNWNPFSFFFKNHPPNRPSSNYILFPRAFFFSSPHIPPLLPKSHSTNIYKPSHLHHFFLLFFPSFPKHLRSSMQYLDYNGFKYTHTPDLEIEQGEFLVLLGPSGCGKTTTLRCLAGLETPDEGGSRSAIGTSSTPRRLNLPPDKRNIGMVFQSYALWPHMTVRKNIGYPLRARGSAGLSRRVDRGDRGPGRLQGPARSLPRPAERRAAAAGGPRAGLVARPDLVLFDEPLSNLDARLRDQVRTQLHELHARLGFTRCS